MGQSLPPEHGYKLFMGKIVVRGEGFFFLPGFGPFRIKCDMCVCDHCAQFYIIARDRIAQTCTHSPKGC